MTYHCENRWWGPDGPDSYGPLYVVGCGQSFESEPDDEGNVDCPFCGMWQSTHTSFKQRLKNDPVTDELRALAKQHPLEADEAFNEVRDAHEWPRPGTWVWEQATH